MIYTLLAIVLWLPGSEAITVQQDFNTVQACLVAANEIKLQAGATGNMKVPILTCLPKGEKQ